MIVTQTSSGKFDLKDLSFDELALFHEALVSYEGSILPNAEEFKAEKESCTQMACAIDHQLIQSKS